jgi:hypothetical protein
MADRYRSWVVRAWSRDGTGVVRMAIEEVRSGLLVELRGERAAEIEGLISAASVRAGSSDAAPGANPAADVTSADHRPSSP